MFKLYSLYNIPQYTFQTFPGIFPKIPQTSRQIQQMKKVILEIFVYELSFFGITESCYLVNLHVYSK